MKKGIEYADKSWNPSTGCYAIGGGTCGVNENCWAYRMSLRLAGRYGYPEKPNSFKPTFHPDKLDQPLKRKIPTRYSACFMGDIAFAEKEWLQQIIDVVEQCPQHIFYFLTKRPELVNDKELIWPDNAWIGVTVNCQDDIWRIGDLKLIDAKYKWVSFEPLYGMILTSLDGIDWIVLGAQSNPDKQPEVEWVEELIRCADYRRVPIFTKPNLTVVELWMELPDMLKKDVK